MYIDGMSYDIAHYAVYFPKSNGTLAWLETYAIFCYLIKCWLYHSHDSHPFDTFLIIFFFLSLAITMPNLHFI